MVVLAGPNGAGKSTFYETRIARYARNSLPFINADLIAKNMAKKGERISDEKAARLAGKARREYLAKSLDFCMETVFSDPKGYKRDFLRLAKNSGYLVFMVFIGLDSAELSHARVKTRVEAGGHAVPPEKLDERFPRTIENLRLAIPHINYVYLFDNSSYDDAYRPVAFCHLGDVKWLRPPIPPWASKVLPGPLKDEVVESISDDMEKVFRKLLGGQKAKPNE